MSTLLRFTDRGLVIAACAAAAAAAALTLPGEQSGTFLAFVVLTAAATLIDVTLPNDVRLSLGLAPALGYALLGHRPVAETLTVFALGVLLATAIRLLARTGVRVADAAAHFHALAAAATVYAALAQLDGWPSFQTKNHTTELSVAGLAGVFLAVVLVETTLRALRHIQRDRVPFLPVFLGQVRSATALHLSLLSVSALLALAYPSLRYWSFPLIVAPLAATQFAFKQFASIRRTYLQTIRALSKVPEMAGYTHKGHSTRVAELSVAVAREMGLGESEVTEIEYAALMHDIGRLSVGDPGMVEATSRTELAIVGAAIVRETGHFPRVAEMIEHQHDAYRRRGEETDRALPPGAKIIKVASSYDDLTKPEGVRLTPWDALERLHVGMTYDYDPVAIGALTRVLEKRGVVP